MSDIIDPHLDAAAEIITAYLSNNQIAAAELPSLISSVRAALASQAADAPAPVELTPAVSIKKSVTPDYLISLEDGKRYKSLKRHLQTSYGMSPDDYRKKWSLPADYPMVAPNYAAARSALARSMGLGRKRAEEAAIEVEPEPVAEVEPAPKAKRGRAKKAA